MVNYIIEKVRYQSEDTTIAALQYIPEAIEKCPAIIMAHGFGLTKEAYIDKFAERFAQSGFVVILFDYRNFGESEGTPRQEINPFMQIDDYKNSVTYACNLSNVDSNRIGIWGTSYSGGHVIVTAATDKRVHCVVTQVPTISGYHSSLRRMTSEKIPAYLEMIKKDRQLRLSGENPLTKSLVGPTDENPIYPAEDARRFYTLAHSLSPSFSNHVTVRSMEYSRMYEPGTYVAQISPTPILFIVALADTVTPTDLCLRAYQDCLPPKHLITISAGHFSPYTDHFETASKGALQWFNRHLNANADSGLCAD